MKIRGVIFDMDGLMFDTERLSMNSWEHVCGEMGVPFHYDMALKITGMNAAGARQVIEDYMGADFDHRLHDELSTKYYDDFFQREGIPIKEGLLELLAYLKEQGIPAAVATSTSRPRCESNLKLAGILESFQAIVCGNEVEHSKPAPDIFLKAAAQLGFSPAECLVLEDSPNGIRAGTSAGCVTIAIPDIVELSDELRGLCNTVLPSLREVIGYLQQHNDCKAAVRQS